VVGVHVVGERARVGAGRAVRDAVEVVQPIPTSGGTAAESLEEAERRIPSVLRHRDRAVTAEDLIELAAATPGVTLGRIEVLPGFKPQQRREGLPGVVSVMVLPQVGVPEPPNPRPGRHTIESVYDWLSPRITLGTELYVIGCEYVPLALSVSIELRPGFDRDQTVELVKTELRRFLWPLVGGGPFETMAGWPLKRPVRERELEVVVSRVPGVDEVRGLKVFEQILGGRWRKKAPGTDGTAEVSIKHWQLPELLKGVVVTEGEAPETLERSEGSGNEVAIPVVPELC
jgi:predicted phage baseplate assembly protein